MMPDMAAMMTAMMQVTTAMPPRVRLSQRFSEAYISSAMPVRSNRFAMKMNSGIEISTKSVISP